MNAAVGTIIFRVIFKHENKYRVKEKRNMVTKSNTLKEISALPEFDDYGKSIVPSEGQMAEMTLEQFAGLHVGMHRVWQMAIIYFWRLLKQDGKYIIHSGMNKQILC